MDNKDLEKLVLELQKRVDDLEEQVEELNDILIRTTPSDIVETL